jgi:hypothetical protein
MPDRNKKRVFVALYFRQSITSDANSHAIGPARFHWAIWIEPKGSKGAESCYQVISQPAYSNIPGSGGWAYNYRPNADYTKSNSMIVRIMIGKLPKDTSYDDVNAILRQIRLPRENAQSLENCVTWTKAAIDQMQRRRWAESFSIRRFVNHARQRASHLYDTRKWEDAKIKENYTPRKFP